MKLRNIMIACGIGYLVYKTGKVTGHVECLKKVYSNIGDKLFDENGEVRYQTSKNSWVTFTKKFFTKGE